MALSAAEQLQLKANGRTLAGKKAGNGEFELLVVIAILAIVAGPLVSSIGKAKQRVRGGRILSDL
jgi:hypothetical protein